MTEAIVQLSFTSVVDGVALDPVILNSTGVLGSNVSWGIRFNAFGYQVMMRPLCLPGYRVYIYYFYDVSLISFLRSAITVYGCQESSRSYCDSFPGAVR